MTKLTFAGIIACLALGGCASTQDLLLQSSRQPTHFRSSKSMSTGVGVTDDTCGQFKFSDPACNPALSAGGGGN
jgi:hypothetical protein